jgi:hypothetical protein
MCAVAPVVGLEMITSVQASAEHLALHLDALRSPPYSVFNFLSASTATFPIAFRRYALETATTPISMGGLDHAITALDVLGSVVQAVPVVGDGLKSATEVTKKICEMVKVRSVIVLLSLHSISVVENETKPRSL